jgi:hypothetical protein
MVVAIGAPACAETPADQEILGFRLGQSAPELAEARNLQDLLGEEVARDRAGRDIAELVGHPGREFPRQAREHLHIFDRNLRTGTDLIDTAAARAAQSETAE